MMKDLGNTEEMKTTADKIKMLLEKKPARTADDAAA
jgi:hypothetical protein